MNMNVEYRKAGFVEEELGILKKIRRGGYCENDKI